MIPKNIVIKTVEATILSLKIANHPGNSISSIDLSSLPPNLGASLLDNHKPNICWWPIAKFASPVTSLVISKVKLENTDQYVPIKIPAIKTFIHVTESKVKYTIARSMVLWTYITCPVTCKVLILVYLEKYTKIKFQTKPISKVYPV